MYFVKFKNQIKSICRHKKAAASIFWLRVRSSLQLANPTVNKPENNGPLPHIGTYFSEFLLPVMKCSVCLQILEMLGHNESLPQALSTI